MGLWNFVKGAGKSLFGAAEAAPAKDALIKEIEALAWMPRGLILKSTETKCPLVVWL